MGVKKVDVENGIVNMTISGVLAEQCPELIEADFEAHTKLVDNYIIASVVA